MCGIAGVLGQDYKKKLGLSDMKHRGPDDEGEWQSEGERLWLGHRRLSILDLTSSGHQPMTCLNGRYVIVFNGEIYNFLELRQDLEGRGYRFSSDSDTEVISAAYDLWGADCLHRFNGMWAFAIWDVSKRELFLARDRFGKKPLYYWDNGATFVFASEVQVLHHWLGERASLDADVIQSICNGEFVWHGTERTYVAGVRSLPAGHRLWRNQSGSRMERWYFLESFQTDVPVGLAAQAESLRTLLFDACRLRMRSDVPLATCLSGGLDSGTLTAILNSPSIQQHGTRTQADHHRAFCIGFLGATLDESDAARSLARQVGADFHLESISAPHPTELMNAIAECDGPMHSMAFYPIWKLYGLIRSQGVKVTLDGQGPDEMMGGYLHDANFAFRDALRHGRLLRLRDLYDTYGNLGESEFLSSKQFVRSALWREIKQPLSKFKQNALSALHGKWLDPTPSLIFTHPIPKSLTAFRAGLYTRFFQNTLPTILQQYERCSMAHGVECRMPFMDHRIVEYLFSLPETSLVGGGYTKRILREATVGILPDETRLNRRKIGFNSPIVEWFSGALRELMLDTMHSDAFRECMYFDGARLASAFDHWLEERNWEGAWAFWPPVHFVLWQSTLRGKP